MFVQNQIRDLPNHETVITDAFCRSQEVRLIVAYVKENGVDKIVGELKNQPTKLLCSFDMGITQMSGVKKLLENGVEVRVYKSSKGTFHPKMWLFKRDDKWRMLVGSANLTGAALVDNVEVGVFLDDERIIANAVMFFNYLWDAENSHVVDTTLIEQLQQQLTRRREIVRGGAPTSETSPDEGEKILFDFVKNWIDIAKSAQQGISAIWRGWYVIPDHGYVNDKLIENLRQYLPFIEDKLLLNGQSPDENYRRLLRKFMQNNYAGKTPELSAHNLFVRQAKNYLIKFGWAYHPLGKNKNGKLKSQKNIFHLSDFGQQINQCRDLRQVKQLYSEYFAEYSYNGLRVVDFTRQLLAQFGKLHLREFDHFVTHAYNAGDLEMMVKLISLYRNLSAPAVFDKKVKQHFDKTKEWTAKSVHGNYVKNIKHTMSVIGWCEGFSLSEDFVLRKDGN